MLEDEYSDIVGKANRGLNKQVDSENVEEVAKELNLKFRALKNIKEGKYKPKEFDYSKTYDGLKVEKISSPFMEGEVNAYIVIGEDNTCVIIDTAQVPDKIIEFVKKEKLEPEFTLETHEHQDHIEGMKKIHEELEISYLDFEDLKDESVISYGYNKVGEEKKKIKVFRTPGHSEKSLTFQIGKFLFVGDLIFAGSFGGGMYSYDKLLKSAKKILNLDENLFIFPGHGPVTTVKEERENNAFFS